MAMEIVCKCPHCGACFSHSQLNKGLTPTHDYPKMCRQVCPGSHQYARGLADTRPLWKDVREK